MASSSIFTWTQFSILLNYLLNFSEVTWSAQYLDITFFQLANVRFQYNLKAKFLHFEDYLYFLFYIPQDMIPVNLMSSQNSRC